MLAMLKVTKIKRNNILRFVGLIGFSFVAAESEVASVHSLE